MRDLVECGALFSRGTFRRCPACGDGNDEAMLLDGMCRHCGNDLSDVDGVETFGFLELAERRRATLLELGETRPTPRQVAEETRRAVERMLTGPVRWSWIAEDRRALRRSSFVRHGGR